ncbi:MAG: aminotransferase class III-fold pyridoxal phosphate-dependent enzyme [Desulfobacterales bacterium]|jgi:4-aminobutyrate aminotransferase-like enzyme/Ser/Thr protein kinase RdoA (MazF antagonist)
MTSLVQHAPRFTEQQAIGIALDKFGLDVSARQLPSERDQNFHLICHTGEQYVLKVANATERIEVLEFQNQVMMHIASHKERLKHHVATAPEVCQSITGRQIVSVDGSGRTKHHVRLLTYLAGKPLARVKPHSPDLLTDLGRFFGSLDCILADFDHPAAHQDFHWDLKNASQVIHRHIGFVKDPVKHDLIEHYQKRFRTQSEPLLAGLDKSVIHNDANDYNVLIASHHTWQNRVSGVIDFGDMVFTYTVGEVAIACAYAMLDKAEPLAAAAHIVAGYHQNRPLTERELSVLFDLICMRLCMSVCHAANQSRQEPDNEYLRISEKPVWSLLKKLQNIHPRLALYVFRHACGLPAIAQSGKIIDWLKDHRQGFASIVDEDLHHENQLILDLSVAASLPQIEEDNSNPAALTEHLFEQMRRAHANVGIGRYQEARLLYTTGQFKVQTDEMPETRTIHLGLDLFMQPNSPVFAPLAGRVHSIGNNRDHLDYGPAIILEHPIEDDQRFYTLYGHLSEDSLEGLVPGMPIANGQTIARIGEPPSNGGWPPHLHFQIILDMLGESGNFPGVARPSEWELWRQICPDPNLILGIPQTCFYPAGRSHEDIMAARRAKLGRNLSISYDKPLKIVRGRGQYLFTETGQAYLDGVNNVCHVGHCHPHVVAAACRQMPVLNTNTRYLHDAIIEYAERLLDKFPDPLNVCYFVCTGSEANELALRMARTFTGQQDIITVDGAYHGNTQSLIDISPYKHAGPGGRGAPPWVHKVIMPDGYRGPYKGVKTETGIRYAAHVGQAVKKIQASGKAPAGFICESMLGCGGQIVLPENYLEEAFKHVREAHGVCIVDEVQVGFGRAGSHFWAFESQDVVPDIVTLGKPIGNGHPLAAVITTPEIADAFANGMEYFNTFGGNPVSCAIGMAVLDVIENENLQNNAHRAGNRLLKGLKELMNDFPLIGDVRGLGLYVGVELVKDRETLDPAPEHADYIINRMKDHGILISTDGPLYNVLKMKPPIVFTEQNADEVVEILGKVFQEDCLQI